MNEALIHTHADTKPGFLRRWLWCAPFMVVVCVLLVRGAARFTVFDDESFSCRRYVLPMREMISALYHGVEPDPPLYYIVENAWLNWTGVFRPLWLRAPSILFFMLGLVVLRRAAAAWFNDRVGQAALIIAAIHPAHLLLGFAARWYSLMFLAVALLLWATASLARGPRAVAIIAWSLAAAMVCYTNYFGPVVVGFAWIAGLACGVRARAVSRQLSAISQHEKEAFSRRACPASTESGARNVRAWIIAAVLALLFYIPWIKPFIHQLTAFPRLGGGVSAYAAQAARTALALASGNLASVRAWWVHVPLAIAAICLFVLTVQDRRRVWPIAVLVMGCFVAGIASLSMLDKYVMTFSGPVCVLMAALLVKSWTAETEGALEKSTRGGPGVGRSPPRATALALGARIGNPTMMQSMVLGMLMLGWSGCYVNLFREQNWSSLRWLDPFGEAATAALQEAQPNSGVIVATHPAACYAVARANEQAAWDAEIDRLQTPGAFVCGLWIQSLTFRHVFVQSLQPRDDLREWRESFVPLASPTGAIQLLSSADTDGHRRSTRIITIDSSEFADDAAWLDLRRRLDVEFSLARELSYLEDPDAAWKDRLDPQFKHPRWRITVRVWDRRSATTAPASGAAQIHVHN